MPWRAHLELDYQRHGERCVVFDRHTGPLRVLASLYPEAPTVCHNVIVHPPGGIVGGDALRTDLVLAENTHALLTTPGATRFYRSAGEPASQEVSARLARGARLEWLPLETCCHRGALAQSRLHFDLAPGAEMIGWDMLSLGLPASGDHFDRGRFSQTLTLGRSWREHGVIDGSDSRLLASPLGLAGHCTMGLLWCASGERFSADRRAGLLDIARALCDTHELRNSAGCSSAHDDVVVLRVLAPRVEPAMQLLRTVWAAWRSFAWGLTACAPRVWRT